MMCLNLKFKSPPGLQVHIRHNTKWLITYDIYFPTWGTTGQHLLSGRKQICQKGNQSSYAFCIFMIYVFIGCTHHLTTSGCFYMFHRQKADTTVVDYEVERYQQNNIHKSQSTSKLHSTKVKREKFLLHGGRHFKVKVKNMSFKLQFTLGLLLSTSPWPIYLPPPNLRFCIYKVG